MAKKIKLNTHTHIERAQTGSFLNIIFHLTRVNVNVMK